MTGTAKPHPYADALIPGRCRECGHIRSYRVHQPFWWRLIHPGAHWR